MNYIVIPAYQPDNKLIKLIEKIHEKSDFHILVIDDGSSSECQKIFDKAEQYATVIRHQVNQGKGQALKTAFTYIQEQNIYGTVVTADADGQHKVWDIFRKFALSSLSSFVVDYIVYALAILILPTVPTSLRIFLANGVARVTSSIFNYSTNKKLVFKNDDSLVKTGMGYFGLAVGLFVLDTLLIRLFFTVFGINLLIAKVIVGILLFAVSWTVQKKFIFKERTSTVL